MANRRILLVEGSNDKHVIVAIQGRREIRLLDRDKEIVECGDDGRLMSSFPVRLLESDIVRLGVVMDADVDVAKRWNHFKTMLTDAGYLDIPNSPEPSGTIIHPPPDSLLPRVGIWLMPDNKETGILEDFLRFLVPPDCELFKYATQVVAAIPSAEVRYPKLAAPKAILHTWLAWQKHPGRPLGQSITAKYLDTEVARVDVFVAWLERLYGEN
jgi:hypothetical protein